MATLERAIRISEEAHLGQTDKAGMPYFLHPMRVMLSLDSEDDKIVGILHDVVEDSDWTFSKLEEEGFAANIIIALEHLTRGTAPKEAYGDFIERCSNNPIALRVKLADLKDNMDLRRLPKIREEDLARLDKYRKATAFLENKRNVARNDPNSMKYSSGHNLYASVVSFLRKDFLYDMAVKSHPEEVNIWAVVWEDLYQKMVSFETDQLLEYTSVFQSKAENYLQKAKQNFDNQQQFPYHIDKLRLRLDSDSKLATTANCEFELSKIIDKLDQSDLGGSYVRIDINRLIKLLITKPKEDINDQGPGESAVIEKSNIDPFFNQFWTHEKLEKVTHSELARILSIACEDENNFKNNQISITIESILDWFGNKYNNKLTTENLEEDELYLLIEEIYGDVFDRSWWEVSEEYDDDSAGEFDNASDDDSVPDNLEFSAPWKYCKFCKSYDHRDSPNPIEHTPDCIIEKLFQTKYKIEGGPV